MQAPPQHWYPVDAFGRDLSATAGGAAHVAGSLEEARTRPENGSVLLVAASWEPVRTLATLSDAALQRGFTLVPVVVNPLHVRVGPVVTGPTTRCCYSCFIAIEQKRNSDNAVGRYLEGVRAVRASGPAPSFVSHIAAHVEIAAALVATCLSDLHAADNRCWYSSHDLADVRLNSFEGIDGCRRCGTEVDDRTRFAGTSWE